MAKIIISIASFLFTAVLVSTGAWSHRTAEVSAEGMQQSRTDWSIADVSPVTGAEFRLAKGPGGSPGPGGGAGGGSGAGPGMGTSAGSGLGPGAGNQGSQAYSPGTNTGIANQHHHQHQHQNLKEFATQVQSHYGPGDGTGYDGEGPLDGTGYGPGNTQ
jgi:hypothetical protein